MLLTSGLQIDPRVSFFVFYWEDHETYVNEQWSS